MTYTKYKTLCSTENQRKAQATLERCQKQYPNNTFRMNIRAWQGKDKKRYQAQMLVRKGTKR